MIKKQTLAAIRSSSMAFSHGPITDPSIISLSSKYFFYSPKFNPIFNFFVHSSLCRTRSLSIRACSFDRDRIFYENGAQLHNISSCNNHSLNKSAAFSADSGNGHAGTPRMLSGEKIVVAVDIDEVLGNFVSALNRFVADRYSSNHSVSEYHVYEFFRIWNCTRDEADIRVHEFFKTPYFKKGIHPIPGALPALQKVSSFCNLSIVTSRQNAIKDHTIQWIENHYPGLFQEIHFGNHFALEGKSRPKSDICRSLGANVLIDDNPRYAMECAEVGIRVLLFDYEKSYPWCKIDSVDQHPLVTKVHSWEEVEHQLVTWVYHQRFTYH